MIPLTPVPFVLSGDSDRALRARARGLRRLLDTHVELDLADVAFTLATAATARDHRAAIMACDRFPLGRALGALAQGGHPAGVMRGVVGAGRADPGPLGGGSVASSAARSYVADAAVDWAAVFGGTGARRVDVPAPAAGRHWLAALAEPGAPPSDAGPPEPTTAPEPPAGLRAELAHLPERRRRAVLLDTVRSLAAEVLERDAVRSEPGERSFQQLGFDSLTAVEFRDRLGRALGVPLSATVIFDHPSPAALAEHAAGELATGATGPAAAVLADLDAVADAVSGLGRADGELRSLLADRLAALLAEVDPAPGPPEAGGFDSATSEEMLAYLDQKLGQPNGEVL